MSRPCFPLPTQQRCIDCRLVKTCSLDRTLSDFTLMVRKGRTGNMLRRYCSYCKSCMRIRHAVWRRAHSDVEKRRRTRYYQDNLEKEKKRLHDKDLRQRTSDVLEVICSLYEITPEQLIAHRRSDALAMEARQVAMYAFCVLGRMGTTEAGRILDRNHSTVDHGIERLKMHPTKEEQWGIRETRRLLGEKRRARRPDECPKPVYQRRRAVNG